LFIFPNIEIVRVKKDMSWKCKHAFRVVEIEFLTFSHAMTETDWMAMVVPSFAKYRTDTSAHIHSCQLMDITQFQPASNFIYLSRRYSH